MNEIEQPENWDQHCIVCQKSVDHGGGMAHFKVAGEMVALCCPLCIETFNKDSALYLRRRALRKTNLGSSDFPHL